MAYREGKRAKTLEGTDKRAPVQNAANPYTALAEKFEAVRGRARGRPTLRGITRQVVPNHNCEVPKQQNERSADINEYEFHR
jgi:hypothetical protein